MAGTAAAATTRLATARAAGRRLPAGVVAAAKAAGRAGAAKEALPARKVLALVGGRGCGKSSVARRLAAVDKRFVLLPQDDLIRIEYGGGATVADIVADRGWDGFRDLEHAVLVKSLALEFTLVDCGGGVVVDVEGDDLHEVPSERKIQALRDAALVVYLRRPVEYLEKRVAKKAAKLGGKDTNRPALSAGLEEVMARRGPWYERVAHVVVEGHDASGSPRPKHLVAADVLAAFYESAGEPEGASEQAAARLAALQLALKAELPAGA